MKEDSNAQEKLNSNISAKKKIKFYLNSLNVNPNADIFQYGGSNTNFSRLKKLLLK